MCVEQETAATHYRTFIQVADALGEVQSQAEAMQERCQSLAQSLPALGSAAGSFASRSQQLASTRADNKQLLRTLGSPLFKDSRALLLHRARAASPICIL